MNDGESTRRNPLTLADVFANLLAAGGLAAGTLQAVTSSNGETQLQGAIVAAGCLLFFALTRILRWPGRDNSNRVTQAAVIAALVWIFLFFLAANWIEWQQAAQEPNASGSPVPQFLAENFPLAFAAVGNAILAMSFFAVQCNGTTKLYGSYAPWFILIALNTMVAAVITGLILGGAQRKEYSEPATNVGVWLMLVWTLYLFVLAGTIWYRKRRKLRGIWFLIGFIAVALVWLGLDYVDLPALVLPHGCYGAYLGVQDAISLWVYGNHAKFVLAGFIWVSYYFLPGRPGSRSVAGLVTDPVIRLMGVPVVYYAAVIIFDHISHILNLAVHGKAMNSLSHYTDWTIHPYSDPLRWGAMVAFGAFYCIVPRLWKRMEMYSLRLVEMHFWIWAAGLLLYERAATISGCLGESLWRAYDYSQSLPYSFVETAASGSAYHSVRAAGGVLFVLGVAIMAANLCMTIAARPNEALEGASAQA